MLSSIEAVTETLAKQHYVADRPLATILYLSQALGKPLFLEGEPGVGKTELAVVLAKALDTVFIRLQCYEGLDASMALYEWNYPRQLLEIKLQEVCGDRSQLTKTIFNEEFLIKRPILQAIQHPGPRPAVLLIDELDRADQEFEAFLLEVLADYQVTIPEIGTLRAHVKPLVILTSNRTRDVHDALKRRCLYHWIEYPEFEKEYAIVLNRLPRIESELAAEVCRFMERMRMEEFLKKPGIAETLDWAAALIAMNRHSLDEEVVEATLGCIFKNQQDVLLFREAVWGDHAKRADYLRQVKEAAC
ncbi:MAG: MoxR family ATPase [Deltaproteobacteria bacterium]|nr:MoxR family ATPase [Deltaproteobacteria bacterium]